jgi:hypothetical protein
LFFFSFHLESQTLKTRTFKSSCIEEENGKGGMPRDRQPEVHSLGSSWQQVKTKH